MASLPIVFPAEVKDIIPVSGDGSRANASYCKPPGWVELQRESERLCPDGMAAPPAHPVPRRQSLQPDRADVCSPAHRQGYQRTDKAKRRPTPFASKLTPVMAAGNQHPGVPPRAAAPRNTGSDSGQTHKGSPGPKPPRRAASLLIVLSPSRRSGARSVRGVRAGRPYLSAYLNALAACFNGSSIASSASARWNSGCAGNKRPPSSARSLSAKAGAPPCMEAAYKIPCAPGNASYKSLAQARDRTRLPE